MKQIPKNDIQVDYSNEKVTYVIVNIIVSALAFIKSFVFMKFLGLYDLGVLTIIQTIIMSIGLLQLGFLNGGYRIFSIGDHRETERINNQIFTYIGVLFSFLFLVGICLFKLKFRITHFLIFVGIIIGISSMICNWLTNTLIAKQLFKRLNEINLISALISILSLPLAYYLRINGAILILFIQPISFIFFCLLLQKELRPTHFLIDKLLIGSILKYGFIPFLMGIFALITTQIERWSILGGLGTISLGKFYLVFLYSSLYVLIPSSINNLFFSNTMRLYKSHDYNRLRHTLTKYYNFVIIILTFLFLSPIISYLLPAHIEGIKFVYWILPGLALISMSEPIGLLYNASVILKPMFWAYFSSVLLYICLLVLLIICDNLSLTYFALMRSIIGTYIFCFFLFSYFKFRKQVWVVK